MTHVKNNYCYDISQTLHDNNAQKALKNVRFDKKTSQVTERSVRNPFPCNSNIV